MNAASNLSITLEDKFFQKRRLLSNASRCLVKVANCEDTFGSVLPIAAHPLQTGDGKAADFDCGQQLVQLIFAAGKVSRWSCHFV